MIQDTAHLNALLSDFSGYLQHILSLENVSRDAELSDNSTFILNTCISVISHFVDVFRGLIGP